MATETQTTAIQPASLTAHSTERTINRGPVTATLNFYDPPTDGSAPFNYVEQPPPGAPQRNYSDAPTTITIDDLRGREAEASLSSHAFAAIQDVPSAATRSTFSSSDEEIKKVYYPEVEELLLQQTGAKRVLLFDHTIRLATPGAKRAPVNRVHVDQTNFSGPQRVHLHLPPSEAEAALKERVRIINVWRPLNPPIVSHPLAFADSRSVPPEAMVGIEHRYPERTGETAAVRWTEGQKWWYWSGMEEGERLLLCCWDTETGVRVPHSAFVDPRSEPGANRESIEVRALVFG
ncbi:MAG: hypothetical protein Q9174_004967 [Haloplaca sp. 1 TL-2023]